MLLQVSHLGSVFLIFLPAHSYPSLLLFYLFSRALIPQISGPRDQFCGRQLFHGQADDGFKMIQDSTFTVYFISVIFTSVPLQIIRH